MRGRCVIPILVAILAVGLIASIAPAAEEEAPYINPKDVPRIAKEDVKAKLGNSDVIIIDVRGPDYLKPGEAKVVGAAAEDPKLVQEWLGKYPKEKTLILYCS